MTYAYETTNEMIDVRDMIERFEELESEMPDADDEAAMSAWDDLAEYLSIKATLDELSGNGGDEQFRGDWYPVTLIRDDYFPKYMDEMLEDCGDLPKDLPCYLSITVDYDALQQDYTSVEINGETYWYR